ncbi:hypothetical protein L209DRAFT_133409 [Thermothelomyces heterothallicus CBS 203.75]
MLCLTSHLALMTRHHPPPWPNQFGEDMLVVRCRLRALTYSVGKQCKIVSHHLTLFALANLFINTELFVFAHLPSVHQPFGIEERGEARGVGLGEQTSVSATVELVADDGEAWEGFFGRNLSHASACRLPLGSSGMQGTCPTGRAACAHMPALHYTAPTRNGQWPGLVRFLPWSSYLAGSPC